MKNNLSRWVHNHTFGLFVFNLIMMVLVLLRTAGYFHPFFIITINLIVICGLILSAGFLGAKSVGVYLIALCFWLLTMFFSVAKVETWSERSSIYCFNAFAVGTGILVLENLRLKVYKFFNDKY